MNDDLELIGLNLKNIAYSVLDIARIVLDAIERELGE